MILLQLRAHDTLPIFFTLNIEDSLSLVSRPGIVSKESEGKSFEISIPGCKLCFVVGRVIARNDSICIETSEKHRVIAAPFRTKKVENIPTWVKGFQDKQILALKKTFPTERL